MKFKVGDKVKGISDIYVFTNTDMYLGEVKKVGDYYIEILILKHKNSNKIGNVYNAYFPEGRFEIVKNKNGKFFKSLSNDFTETLEVENGFIVEKEILDDAEKEYLSAVIKPFRNKIVSISKEKCCNEGYFINVELENDVLIFPDFKNETMYEGMELEKQYTLKELGLDE